MDEQGDAKIIELLKELKHVDAPKDFDFRVKARIAAGRPSEVAGFRLPVLVKYALPLVLLLLVGGYFGITRFYSTNDANVPAVAEKQIAVPSMDQTIAESTVKPAENAPLVAKTEEKQTAPLVTNELVKKPAVVRNDRTGGGSFVEASRIPRKIYQRQSASELLTEIGVQGSFEATGVKVDSATTNGIGERSGIKPGDVIESVNGQPVTEKSSIKGRSTLTVRVKRDGKTVDIVLKNN